MSVTRTSPDPAEPDPPDAPRSDAVTAAPGLESLRVISVSHRTTSLDQLERYALSPAAAAACAERLVRHGSEAVALITCGRVELYWRALEPWHDELARETLRDAIRDGAAPLPEAMVGEAAARHLFRVVSGLESQVLGEGEVMGQVRDALDASSARGFLAGVFQSALRCGGRVRAETGLGAGAVSVASVAVERLAADGPLAGLEILVVGAGDTGIKAARHLRAVGATRLVMMNRTLSRARHAAAPLGAEARPLSELAARLVSADVVVVATRVSRPLLDAPLAAEVRERRRGCPLRLVDLSMPRAIAPAWGEVPGWTLHSLAGLEGDVRAHRADRQREIARAERVLERELRWLHVWAHQQMIRPLLADMRRRIETIRAAEIEHARRDGLRDVEAVDRLTRRLVDRLLAVPALALRRGRHHLDDEHLRVLRSLLLATPAEES